MAPTWSKLLRKFTEQISPQNVVLAGSLLAASVGTYKAVTWTKGATLRLGQDLHLHVPEKTEKKDKANVDAKFFRKAQKFRFAVGKSLTPKGKSIKPDDLMGTGFLILIAFSLVARTYCDVWMMSNTTVIERDIISRDTRAFVKDIFSFLYAMPLISLTNQLLKYGINELKLRFRSRLTLYLQSQYLSGFTYYKMSNLDSRIANPDQLLTQDVDKFCQCVVDLYSNVSKPILDIFIYVRRLTGTIGAGGPAGMIGYLVLAGIFLTRLRKPVGKMTIQEQRLEGEFRYVNSRIIANSEEIAFYQGNTREHMTVKTSFQRLVDHLRDSLNFRFNVGIIDNIIAKYLASVVGFATVARSFLSSADERRANMTHDEIMEDYYHTGRMMLKCAEAVGRLGLAGREMTRLAGFTARMTELMNVLSDLRKGRYVRTMVSSFNEDTQDRQKFDLGSAKGELIEQDHIIRFEEVPLITPNSDVLISDMSFEVKSGVNVLVCGPNGCGKSSLFRVLGELWPAFGGRLIKPHRSKLFYIPQRPYMTIGTFRDQIIYPDSFSDMRRKGFNDKDLEDYLKKVQLSYILEREGGWDTIQAALSEDNAKNGTKQDWIDVLSGGEKQRVAMARLFYHKPQFAILDECTSAVSVDVEGYMYTHCKEYVLYMNGRGGYQFEPMETCKIDFGS